MEFDESMNNEFSLVILSKRQVFQCPLSLQKTGLKKSANKQFFNNFNNVWERIGSYFENLRWLGAKGHDIYTLYTPRSMGNQVSKSIKHENHTFSSSLYVKNFFLFDNTHAKKF